MRCGAENRGRELITYRESSETLSPPSLVPCIARWPPLHSAGGQGFFLGEVNLEELNLGPVDTERVRVRYQRKKWRFPRPLLQLCYQNPDSQKCAPQAGNGRILF